MSREERSGKRSLTFSRWHRTLPDYCTTIDIDFAEYCTSCTDVLALIETTRDNYKATTIIERLAEMAHLPAFVIYYTEHDEQIASAKLGRVYPDRTSLQTLTPTELRGWFVSLHDHHRGNPCPGQLAATRHWQRRSDAIGGPPNE